MVRQLIWLSRAPKEMMCRGPLSSLNSVCLAGAWAPTWYLWPLVEKVTELFSPGNSSSGVSPSPVYRFAECHGNAVVLIRHGSVQLRKAHLLRNGLKISVFGGLLWHNRRSKGSGSGTYQR